MKTNGQVSAGRFQIEKSNPRRLGLRYLVLKVRRTTVTVGVYRNVTGRVPSTTDLQTITFRKVQFRDEGTDGEVQEADGGKRDQSDSFLSVGRWKCGFEREVDLPSHENFDGNV